MKKFVLLALCFIGIGGCVGNGFSQYYGGQALEQVQAIPGYVAENGITVRRTSFESLANEPNAVMNKMFEKGYVPVGFASWEGPSGVDDDAAKAQAQKIGASYVVWGTSYSRTDSGVRPVTTYNPGSKSTTYHSGAVVAGNNSAQYYGQSTTYNSGTYSTNYVPYSVNKFKYLGVFFVKIMPGRLGAKLDDPGEEYKKKFDTSSGAKVVSVMSNGRGARANIMPGDIIMSVNGVPFERPQGSNWQSGKENILQIWRDGNTLTKSIFLEADSIN